MKCSIITAASVLGLSLAGFAGPGHAAQPPANPGHLKMGLVSAKLLYTDSADAAANQKNLQSNLERHLYFIDKLAAQGCEFIGFPEASINGYHYSANMTWLKLDGPEVKVLEKKAIEKGVYISAGLAEQDAAGKKWEAQIVIGPDGKIVGLHHKNWLTKEKSFIQASTEHNVFPVKGTKMGIVICADGSDFRNLKALADGGAKIIYGPHANTTGGTIAGWYRFRARWAGPWNPTMVKSKDADNAEVDMPTGGWIAGLKVYAALDNHAGLYNPEYNPPVPPDQDTNKGWASGAWFIGPDGSTLAQMPTSTQKSDSKEYVLIYNVPLR